LSDRGYTLARTLGLLIWGLFLDIGLLQILQDDTGGVLVVAVGFIASGQAATARLAHMAWPRSDTVGHYQ
jgi:hypothetical protein